MRMPNQSEPVNRCVVQTQPSLQNSGVDTAGYEECFNLPYLAQQLCLQSFSGT